MAGAWLPHWIGSRRLVQGRRLDQERIRREAPRYVSASIAPSLRSFHRIPVAERFHFGRAGGTLGGMGRRMARGPLGSGCPCLGRNFDSGACFRQGRVAGAAAARRCLAPAVHADPRTHWDRFALWAHCPSDRLTVPSAAPRAAPIEAPVPTGKSGRPPRLRFTSGS